MLDPDLSVLEKLNQAYDLILDALRQAPQLSATSLDLAPLLLLSAMRRAQRSPRMRARPRYREQELPF